MLNIFHTIIVLRGLGVLLVALWWSIGVWPWFMAQGPYTLIHGLLDYLGLAIWEDTHNRAIKIRGLM